MRYIPLILVAHTSRNFDHLTVCVTQNTVRLEILLVVTLEIW